MCQKPYWVFEGRAQTWPARPKTSLQETFLFLFLVSYSFIAFEVWKMQDFCFIRKREESKQANCRPRLSWYRCDGVSVLGALWTESFVSLLLHWGTSCPFPTECGGHGKIQVPLELTPKTTLEEWIGSKATFNSKCYSAFQFWLLHSDLWNSTVLGHKHSTLVLSGLYLSCLCLSVSVCLYTSACLSVSPSLNVNTNFSAKVALC